MMLLAEMMLGMALTAAPLAPDAGAADAPALVELDRADAQLARARFSLMRADEVELAWVEGVFRLPEFEGRRVMPDVIRFEAPWLDADSGRFAGTGRTLRFEVDRDTALRDGGISGAQGAIAGDDGLMRLSSLAAGEGEYDIYDLALSWDALSPGPVTLSVIGGLKAIDARIGKVVESGGSATFEDARGLVAVPVIGGGVSWRVNEDLTLTGTASTQTFEGQGSVLDLSAETSIRLAPNVGISAGYQFIRSAIEVQSLETDLEREGLFARLQIRF